MDKQQAAINEANQKLLENNTYHPLTHFIELAKAVKRISELENKITTLKQEKRGSHGETPLQSENRKKNRKMSFFGLYVPVIAKLR